MLVSVESEAKSRGELPAGGMGVALVTGGRRGIGRATCLALAQRGFDVAFIDIVDDDMAGETLAMIEDAGRQSVFIPFDIAAIDRHVTMVDEVEKVLGPISCLVNNAGIQVPVRGDLLDVAEDSFDRLLDVNLRGTFFLTQEVARRMVAAPAGSTMRSIITVTSANAHLVSPEKGAYCISKAALSMAMQNFAVRLAEHDIRVHEIRPGLIETDMTTQVREHYSSGISGGAICPMRRWGTPKDIADAIGTLASGLLPFSTGDIYNIGGGMQIPRL